MSPKMPPSPTSWVTRITVVLKSAKTRLRVAGWLAADDRIKERRAARQKVIIGVEKRPHEATRWRWPPLSFLDTVRAGSALDPPLLQALPGERP